VDQSARSQRCSAPGVRITERDRQLLSFVAAHRFVLSGQVQTLLGVSAASAYARLHALCQAGYLDSHRLLHGQPGCYQIARGGLRAIESTLPRPRAIDLSCYRHDVGLGWLWLAAWHGSFGPVRDVASERRMRSHDGRSEDRETQFGVRLGGVGPGGRDRLHYPDLILETESGHRVALELELTGKSRRRLDGILAGYAIDRRIDAVLYLVDKPAIGKAAAQSAARLGISHRVHVQRVEFGAGRGSAPHGAATRPHRPEAAR
jgi:DNA-binding PadR family transcriptional regulator